MEEHPKRANTLRTVTLVMAFVLQLGAIAYWGGTTQQKIAELDTKVEMLTPVVDDLRIRVAVAEATCSDDSY